MTDSPDFHDTPSDSLIPVLQDILVPGKTRVAQGAQVGVYPVASPQVDTQPFAADAPPFQAAALARDERAGLDADRLAERLRGRVAGYLSGEGREAIEAHCRDALNEYTGWLVSQITREVALALETELNGWVREAVDEALTQRASGH